MEGPNKHTIIMCPKCWVLHRIDVACCEGEPFVPVFETVTASPDKDEQEGEQGDD
jgi:hypothetical protein